MPFVGVLAGDRRVGLLDAEVRLAMAVPYQRGARERSATLRPRLPSPQVSGGSGQASMTTGTIIGRRRGALADELAGRPADLPLEALDVAHAVLQRPLDRLGHPVARLVEQVLGLGRVAPSRG